jgi:hypothetical protein
MRHQSLITVSNQYVTCLVEANLDSRLRLAGREAEKEVQELEPEGL